MTEPAPTQRVIGDSASRLVELTDHVPLGDVWELAEIAKRDRSLATIASLITSGSVDQFPNHLRPPRRRRATPQPAQ